MRFSIAQKSPRLLNGDTIVHSVKSASSRKSTLKDVYELAYFTRLTRVFAKFPEVLS